VAGGFGKAEENDCGCAVQAINAMSVAKHNMDWKKWNRYFFINPRFG
jgi:hypothetical protein